MPMPNDAGNPVALTYGEVRVALTRRAEFESHQEGEGKSPHYVLSVRPRGKSYEPFTLTGPDPAMLLREALAQLVGAETP